MVVVAADIPATSLGGRGVGQSVAINEAGNHFIVVPSVRPSYGRPSVRASDGPGICLTLLVFLEHELEGYWIISPGVITAKFLQFEPLNA